jgi:hypothetical protein
MLNPPSRSTRSPVHGTGWQRVAQSLAESVSPADVEEIWLFSPVRGEGREWGTAVIACRADDDRRRIFTAKYVMVVRGRDRGQGRVPVEEVGQSPETVLHEVIAGVQDRAGESEPPIQVAPEEWYPRGEAGSSDSEDTGP